MIWHDTGINKSWSSIASSSDGGQIAAITSGTNTIQISKDAGLSWGSAGDSPSTTWYEIKSSYTGATLVAIKTTGNIFYVSKNNGVSWSAKTVSGAVLINMACISNDGTKIAITYSISGGTTAGIISINSGDSFIALSIPAYSTSIACNNDFSVLYCSKYSGGNAVYISTNQRASWSASLGAYYFIYMSVSFVGSTLIGSAKDGNIYKTINSGSTWTSIYNTYPYIYSTLSASSDCSKLIISPANTSTIYTSVDTGDNWNLEDITGKSVSSNSTGTLLIAGGSLSSNLYITYYDIPIKIDIDGVWKDVLISFVNHNGVWKEINNIKLALSGVWKELA